MPTGVPGSLAGMDVWITNIKTGQSMNLTQSKASARDPVWSRDGNALAFYSDRVAPRIFGFGIGGRIKCVNRGGPHNWCH